MLISLPGLDVSANAAVVLAAAITAITSTAAIGRASAKLFAVLIVLSSSTFLDTIVIVF